VWIKSQLEVNYESNGNELKFYSKLTKNELKVRYKFITSHGWPFKWMNSMALTFVTLLNKLHELQQMQFTIYETL